MSKLMELVDDYGILRYRLACIGGRNHASLAARADERKAEIRAAVAELERDAARFHYLQNIDKKEAQAFFWHFESRKQRAKAIDAAMETANVPER